ncbi:MAG: glycosyltransferase family A protein [Bacteroidota bacterium]
MPEISSMDSQPYISIIFSGRNDNYGGDFNYRLQNTVNWYAYWVEKYQLHTELLIVNYNPIPDAPGLEEMISWPKGRKYLEIKLLHVPGSIHKEYVNLSIRKTVPLFEFIAKNLAIPRAKGEFILCTNADILFSPSIFEWISKRQLKPGILYRSDRYDFKNSKSFKWPENDEEYESFELDLERHVFKFFIHGGIYRLSFPKNIDLRKKLFSFYQSIRTYYYTRFTWIPIIREVRILPMIPKEQLFFFKYHCNAAGDFALMGKQDWMDIRGYLEDTWISTHTDSLQVLSSVFSGKKIEVLPFPCYHQHHERRYDFIKKNPDMDIMQKRLNESYAQMESTKQPIINDNDNWWLPGHNLQITTI